MNRDFSDIHEVTTIGTIAPPVVDGNNFFRGSDTSDRSAISDTKPDEEPNTKSLPEIRSETKDLQTWILQQTFCSQVPVTCMMHGLYRADNFTDRWNPKRRRSVKPE